ncbi:MAG: glutamine-hydrolyzing GMP synthase, partial [Eubacteriales bacterium]|nr:glutamine-hydrolyzing GMP synthase [Eubacteriales bacterium]
MLNQVEKVLIIDFGGPEKTIVAREIRESHVFSEVKSPTITAAEIRQTGYKAVFLCGRPTLEGMTKSGGVRPGIPFDKEIFALDIPILAFSFAARVMMQLKRGQVAIPGDNEDGAWDAESEELKVEIVKEDKLLAGLGQSFVAHSSSPYFIKSIPAEMTGLARAENMPYLISGDLSRHHYALDLQAKLDQQVVRQIIQNFLGPIAGVKADWRMEDYLEFALKDLRERCGDKHALLALSGGVDSSVVAALAHRALGDKLHAVFVDHGFMRLNEPQWIEEIFRKERGLNLKRVDAEERFLGKLAGVTDPEQKRKIIGEEFIRVFEEEARALDNVDFLLQGTIYPDVIESGIGAKKVKSHHNVGGLPEDIGFEAVLEPLRPLYKEEVRELGRLLGLPEDLVNRQPFPGPGLAVRCLGECRKEKLDLLREADHIYREELEKAGFKGKIGQYFAVITEAKSVGTTQGGERRYADTIALRAVETTDFMTAKVSRLPWDLLEHIATRIITELEGVSRVVYDISPKPPATIEW